MRKSSKNLFSALDYPCHLVCGCRFISLPIFRKCIWLESANLESSELTSANRFDSKLIHTRAASLCSPYSQIDIASCGPILSSQCHLDQGRHHIERVVRVHFIGYTSRFRFSGSLLLRILSLQIVTACSDLSPRSSGLGVGESTSNSILGLEI